MREIKFRGKIRNGKWVYGYAAKFAHGSVPVILEDTENGIEPRIIIPDTVGQFTGLHDKNGKEIYEGDIVKWILTMPAVGVNGGYEEYETEEIGEIQWDAGALHLGEYCAAGFAYESEDYAEVIGNIHDNPELLKTE